MEIYSATALRGECRSYLKGFGFENEVALNKGLTAPEKGKSKRVGQFEKLLFSDVNIKKTMTKAAK